MGGIVRQNENEDELTSHDALQMFPRFNRIGENSGGVTKEMLEETWPHFFGSKRSIDDDNWFDKGFHELEYKNIEYTDRCLTAEIKMGSVRFDEISSFGLKEYRQIKKGFFLS